MQDKELISKAMSLLGSRTSAAKKRASVRNAAKGRRVMARLAKAGNEVRGRKPEAEL